MKVAGEREPGAAQSVKFGCCAGGCPNAMCDAADGNLNGMKLPVG